MLGTGNWGVERRIGPSFGVFGCLLVSGGLICYSERVVFLSGRVVFVGLMAGIAHFAFWFLRCG